MLVRCIRTKSLRIRRFRQLVQEDKQQTRKEEFFIGIAKLKDGRGFEEAITANSVVKTPPDVVAP